jgi:hypothetical protein
VSKCFQSNQGYVIHYGNIQQMLETQLSVISTKNMQIYHAQLPTELLSRFSLTDNA